MKPCSSCKYNTEVCSVVRYGDCQSYVCAIWCRDCLCLVGDKNTMGICDNRYSHRAGQTVFYDTPACAVFEKDQK